MMKKIPSLFKRDYDGDRQVSDEVVPGSEWVLNGEGIPTVKMDGTACKIQDGVLFKRYDRKLSKNAKRKLKQGDYIPKIEDYKPAPKGWEAAEAEPNQHTGHWPGWIPVSQNDPEDKWHREAWETCLQWDDLEDGTYELCGHKVQGNPYELPRHYLWKHGEIILDDVPRDFEGLKEYLQKGNVEGIVWHHSDGRMVKIKRKDFGFEWPINKK